MKLIKLIAAAVIGTSLLTATPTEASVLIELHSGTITRRNDGNPYMYTVQGCRTHKTRRSSQELAYPLKGEGPGASDTRNLDQKTHQGFARLFYEDEMAGNTYKNGYC